MRRIVILYVIFAVVSQITASAAPRLSVEQVIRIADAELTKRQHSPSAYQRPPGYNYAFREDLWRVFYNRKQAAKSFTPQPVFVVTVADKTKQVTFSRAK
ncbi:MAG TPA: hypothetical protein VK993_15895 [Chthoniobacterales bacterium]|nr:hypothetical protein [Chthoniobacterales bacterium]